MLKDGTEFTGRVVARNEARVTLVLDPLTDRRTEVAVGDIRSESASPISTMPEGLLSTFSREEILDLIAYLESDGRPEASAFAKP